MKQDRTVRGELLALLEGGNAHMDFTEATADLPEEHINSKPPNSPYSFWHLVEHIRIAQWDILEFIRNPRHQSPPYPEGYRPRPSEMADGKRWQESLEAVAADLSALHGIVEEGRDLLTPIPHAPEYTIFREILVAADHMAYHVGEIAMMRQIMGLWPESRPYLTG